MLDFVFNLRWYISKKNSLSLRSSQKGLESQFGNLPKRELKEKATGGQQFFVTIVGFSFFNIHVIKLPHFPINNGFSFSIRHFFCLCI